MSWTIHWSDQGLSDLGNLDRPVSQRVVKKLESVVVDPERYFARLKGGDDYKLRIGDYRVLAELDHANRRLTISKVGHRSNVYER